MKEGLLERFGRVAREIICGPEIIGNVEFVKRDQNDPEFWHVLVQTDQGDQRHIIWKDRSIVITGSDLANEEIPWRRGDRFQANMRGNGILLEGPGSIKLEKDPFNLNQK